MAVTVKKISEISGVSRGTVDRVLNGRGGVSEKTRQHVERVAAQLGYKPNLAGKALAVRKKSYVIGVLLACEGNPFFDEVIDGIRKAESEISEYGVSVMLKTIKGYDSNVQIKAISEMQDQINALILNPINEPVIEDKIKTLVSGGLPVFAVNTTVENSSALCYVGTDYFENGRIACGIMGLILPKESNNIAVLTGSEHILGHNQRVEGFRSVMNEKFPKWNLIEVFQTNDDDNIAYNVTKDILQKHPSLDGIYIAAAGTYGVCQAVSEEVNENVPIIICTDSVPETKLMLKKGIIKAAICQQPFVQGYQVVQKAFSFLLSANKQEDFIVSGEILISESLY